jgi:hypothetical protein
LYKITHSLITRLAVPAGFLLAEERASVPMTRVTLSLLQQRLSDLGTGIRVVTGYAL